jgi:23S rRNA (pseudouridine1915-N3)-methyltransferase
MTIRLLSIGKTQNDYLKKGIQLYVDRLQHYARIEYMELPDVSQNGLTPAQLKQREAELILKNLRSDHLLFLLDEFGKSYTSREFAAFFQKQMNAGTKALVLCIGGAYGFDATVHQRAVGKISMSQMTMPHELIRLFLVEQVYRAHTILKGEKYHHD